MLAWKEMLASDQWKEIEYTVAPPSRRRLWFSVIISPCHPTNYNIQNSSFCIISKKTYFIKFWNASASQKKLLKKRIISELHKNACVLIFIDSSITWVTNLGMSSHIFWEGFFFYKVIRQIMQHRAGNSCAAQAFQYADRLWP